MPTLVGGNTNAPTHHDCREGGELDQCGVAAPLVFERNIASTRACATAALDAAFCPVIHLPSSITCGAPFGPEE